MMYAFSVGLSLLLLACIADVWTTLHGLKHGLVERNMAVRWATNWPWLLWVLKAAFFAVSLWQLYAAYQVYPRVTVALTIGSAWLTAFIALRNVKLAAVMRENDSTR